MNMPPTIAYVIEPRFPGGTSAAVARELKIASRFGSIEIHGVTSKMFGDRPVSPVLQEALNDLRLDIIWDAPQISADLVILHNPSFLKFQQRFEPRIVARHLVVVTHENFIRPGGFESYDVAKCLDMIRTSSLVLHRTIAPVSQYNRSTTIDWLQGNSQGEYWVVSDDDWFNICDFTFLPPREAPQDRRGRHSRPGIEKFPSLTDMDACFPKHALSNVILGADPFLKIGLARPHWQAYPFQGIEVKEYFEMIDFMVYFTAPTLRESFGRVLAEGVAAGKVVISDVGTASVFEGAVVASTPQGVDALIAGYVSDPESYHRHVEQAQRTLRMFSSDRFTDGFSRLMTAVNGRAA